MNVTIEFLVSYGYAALFACVLAEQRGLPLPAAPFGGTIARFSFRCTERVSENIVRDKVEGNRELDPCGADCRLRSCVSLDDGLLGCNSDPKGAACENGELHREGRVRADALQRE